MFVCVYTVARTTPHHVRSFYHNTRFKYFDLSYSISLPVILLPFVISARQDDPKPGNAKRDITTSFVVALLESLDEITAQTMHPCQLNHDNQSVLICNPNHMLQSHNDPHGINRFG
eukprot:313885_1